MGVARTTSATSIVTNTNDDGPGSLRDAILLAQNADVIQFDPAMGGRIIVLSSGPLTVTGKFLTIIGPLAGVTISGNKLSSVVHVESDAFLELSNVTITEGYTGLGSGGGIVAEGSLTLRNSTVVNNSTDLGFGGGIYAKMNLLVINSTITGNSSLYGGGIYVDAGQADFVNTTITGNGAGYGGGLYGNSGTLRLWNSIVAGNTASNIGNCFIAANATLSRVGTNLSDNTECGSASASLIVADPQLGPLASNGGPTQTFNLLPTSPAIDAATNCTVNEDQRYVARPKGAACDIGAVEFNDYVVLGLALDASVVVNSTSGVAAVTGTLTCSTPMAATVRVNLSQAQKVGKVNSTVQATADVAVNCTSSHAFAVALTPATGAFKNGTGTVSASTVNTNNTTIPSSGTQVVKMVWGHK